MRKKRVMEETEEWIKKNCDDKGNQAKTNVSPAMRLGIKRVKERVEKGEVVVVPTDKSGKFAIMPLDVYEEMGRVHTEGATIINESELSDLQRELNNHVKMFTKVFNVGVTHGEKNVERIRSGFTSGANGVAILWLVPKDHKEKKDGIPMASRPVVSITNTILARFSRLVTTVVRTLADNIRGTTEVKSCENLKADIVKLNRVLKETALKAATNSEEEVEEGMSEGLKYINEMMPKIMLSEDVKALYPSIKRDIT